MFNFFKGVLGINARNLLYIDVLNSKKARFFAKSKLAVKKYLEMRDVPMARTLDILYPKRGIYKIEENYWSKYEKKGFVIKPNKGGQGTGITVIKSYDKEKDVFIKVSDKPITKKELSYEVSKIWQGEYSIDGKPDAVLIEERIINNNYIQKIFEPMGLPDVRVIVRNMIPIMAMLRVPTPISDGKANLDKGAYGVAINIANGKCIRIYKNGKFYKKINKNLLSEVTIPFWEEILVLASKLQKITNIGFLACDFVLTNDGPLLLEINGRGGLKIQIPNQMGLHERLEMVRSIKPKDEYQAVSVVKNLFGSGTFKEPKVTKKIISPNEKISLILPYGEPSIISKIDLHSDLNFIDKKIFDEVTDGVNEVSNFRFRLEGEKFNLKFYPKDFSKEEYKILLGRDVAKSFLIDVSKNTEKSKFKDLFLKESMIKNQNKNQSVIRGSLEKITKIVIPGFHQKPKLVLTDDEFKTDRDLVDFHKRIPFISYFSPSNVDIERQEFIRRKGDYNPIFKYDVDLPVESLRRDILDMRIPKGRFEILFERKRNELVSKLNIIEMIGKDPDELLVRSLALFGEIDSDLINESNSILTDDMKLREDNEFLQKNEIENLIKVWSKELLGLPINVIWKENLVSPAALGRDKNLHIRFGSRWSRWRLRSMFEHEIGVHYLRFLNATKIDMEVLKIGTGFYLETEEGLAIYCQNEFTPRDKKRYYSPYSKYLLAYHAKDKSFKELFSMYAFSDKDLYIQFNDILRVKRGVRDTSKGGGFMKDIVYLNGFKKVEQLPKTIKKKLFFGKISLEDLSLFNEYIDIDDLYLPESI